MSELPEGWTEATLGDLLVGIDAGRSFRCEERPPKDHEFGVVKISAVTWGTYDEAESKTCTNPKLVEPSFLINDGDLLFSRANTIELVGASVIAERVTKRVMLSDKVLRLRTKLGVEKKWILYFLRSRAGRTQIEALATGNQQSMRNIGQDRLRSIGLSLPPLAEQRRIVEKVEALLARHASASAALQRAASSIEQLDDLLSNAAADGSLISEELRPSRVRLLEVLKEPLANGRSVVDDPDGFPVLRLNAITRRGVDFTQRKLGAWTAEEAARFLIRDDDFLVARGNGSLKLVGRGARVSGIKEAVAYPDTVIRVRTDRQKLHSEFLEIIWNSRMVRDQIESRARTTAGIHKISQRDLEAIEIPWVEPEVQSTIVSRYDAIIRSSGRIGHRIRSVESRMRKVAQSILAKAFDGELVPTEAELAQREERNYEPASELLERIREEREPRQTSATGPRSRTALVRRAARSA